MSGEKKDRGTLAELGQGGSPAPASRRIAVLLEYEGTRFAGSQFQTNGRTVQGVLEDAIERATTVRSRAAFAGRTDAGVHAWGQVASFLTATALPLEVLHHALNAWLPEDVVVRDIAEAPMDFDVRRDARRRHYRYVIDNGPVRPALERARVWHVAQPLDVGAMTRAADHLVGQRDFAAFASPLEREGASTVRSLHCFSVVAKGQHIQCDAVANAFLPHQVRRMVGALLSVGLGRMSPEEYEALLAGAASTVGPAAPAQGLYLMSVGYEWPLFAAKTTVDSEIRV